MTYEEFIGLVEERGYTDTTEEAKRATRAVLETLGERLPADEAAELASRLPAELAEYLQEQEAGEEKPFSLEEFVGKVAKREGQSVDIPKATYHSRVVLEVLGVATHGEIENVRARLPDEYAPLFEAGSQGGMSAP